MILLAVEVPAHQQNHAALSPLSPLLFMERQIRISAVSVHFCVMAVTKVLISFPERTMIQVNFVLACVYVCDNRSKFL
jgi:hypothetical protein